MKKGENGMGAKRGNGHFPHFPIPFILSCHVGGRLQFHTREEKVGRQKKQKISQQREKEGGRRKAQEK